MVKIQYKWIVSHNKTDNRILLGEQNIMPHLNKGDVVKTTDGEPISILSELGEGGEGCVYKVSWRDKKYALKCIFIIQAESQSFKKNMI